MENVNIDCHHINRHCANNVSDMMVKRLTGASIEERLDATSMAQMFSFWSEMQALLIDSSKEIKELKIKINTLENKNEKE